MHAWSIMSREHVKYKDNFFINTFWAYLYDNFAKIWYIYILCKEHCHWTTLNGFLWSGENALKYHYNLMRYFDVILLSEVISLIGPKISDCGTYHTSWGCHFSPDVLNIIKINVVLKYLTCTWHTILSLMQNNDISLWKKVMLYDMVRLFAVNLESLPTRLECSFCERFFSSLALQKYA